MSPFAGYTDFADCVAKNKDKRDPEAYCATIMRKVEGEKMESKNNVKENERPPKDWFDRCVSSVGGSPEVTDPEALCAWNWYHHMKHNFSPKEVEAIKEFNKSELKEKDRKETPLSKLFQKYYVWRH